jgi:Xaa-Pro aminopeptidase
MVLCDAGAANDMNYAGDLTTTYPVGKKFSTKQKDVYNIVLHAHQTAVAMLKPGVLYKDVYLTAAQKIVEGMQSLGVMKGDAKEAVAGSPCHVFQCGLGHMIGWMCTYGGSGELYLGIRYFGKSTRLG